MHNDFNQKDYEFIQEKYKHKNDLEGADRKVQISSSHTNKNSNNQIFKKNFSSYKDNKYKSSVSRKSNVNTCEISKKYKKKLKIVKGDETIDNNNINSEQYTKKKMSAA